MACNKQLLEQPQDSCGVDEAHDSGGGELVVDSEGDPCCVDSGGEPVEDSESDPCGVESGGEPVVDSEGDPHGGGEGGSLDILGIQLDGESERDHQTQRCKSTETQDL